LSSKTSWCDAAGRGTRPRHDQASRRLVTAYVVNGYDGTVTPVNTATNRPERAIRLLPVGDDHDSLSSIGITPNGRTVYVLDYGDLGSLTPISTATNKRLRDLPGYNDQAEEGARRPHMHRAHSGRSAHADSGAVSPALPFSCHPAVPGVWLIGAATCPAPGSQQGFGPRRRQGADRLSVSCWLRVRSAACGRTPV
jgi:hypothetical protein